MRSSLFSLFFLLPLFALPQSKHGNIWVSGNTGQRINFTSNGIFTGNPFPINTIFSQGNTNICDTNGSLILSSDGYNLYNATTGSLVEEGDTLVPNDIFIQQNGFSSSPQSSIILPMDSNKYYFINATFSDARQLDCNTNNHCSFDLLLYNVVDMNANGGAGKVIKRMVPLMENAELSKAQMMACRHSNGKDWWLLKQGIDSNVVHVFLFTQDSVYNFGSQSFAIPKWGTWDLMGQSTFNSTGDKYATTVQGLGGYEGQVAMFDFDRCYGILSNVEVITAPPIVFPPDPTKFDQITTGLCYSPNGQFLYVALQFDIYQYDLIDKTWYIVAGMDTSYSKFTHYSNMYLGPNAKIYIGNFHGTSKQMSVIDSPDVKGSGCSFCPRCLRTDSLFWGYLGTPPCMPDYDLGAKTCWPLDTENVHITIEWSFYPNPAFQNIIVRNAKGKKKVLYNELGQAIFSTIDDKMDVSGLSKGVYFLFCDGSAKKVMVE